jgi:hypothetical protein
MMDRDDQKDLASRCPDFPVDLISVLRGGGGVTSRPQMNKSFVDREVWVDAPLLAEKRKFPLWVVRLPLTATLIDATTRWTSRRYEG